MTDANTPAFPVDEFGNQRWQEYGLNKREYFAAMAMQGMIYYALENPGQGMFKACAKDAVTMADDLIEALNQKEKDEQFLKELDKENK